MMIKTPVDPAEIATHHVITMNATKKAPYIFLTRRSIRLKGYDYAQAGLYFITLNCKDRHQLFGEVIHGKMYLNPIGVIAYQEWLNTEVVRENCAVHDFIIMPDHIHGIIEIRYKIHTPSNRLEDVGVFQSPSMAVGSIVRGIKISVIKKIKDYYELKELKEDSGMEMYVKHPDSVSQFISRGELQFTTTNELQFTTTNDLYEKIKELNFKIWQRDYYEMIIRNEISYRNISRYIQQNPIKWKNKNSR
jgi:REP element-mobilizing transposase RayT